jgi:hypothetical protein
LRNTANFLPLNPVMLTVAPDSEPVAACVQAPALGAATHSGAVAPPLTARNWPAVPIDKMSGVSLAVP